jgi:cytoskeletal protein RodZ
MSLRQIADATKISMGALEALERDDISRLPGGIFARAFVRSYANQVGLVPEEAIRDFMAQFPSDSVTVGHPTAHSIEDNEAVESERRIARAVVRLAGVSVLLIGFVLYLSSRPVPRSATTSSAPRPSPSPVEHEAPAASVVENDATAPTAGSLGDAIGRPAGRNGPAPAAERMVVRLAASAPCWVSVVVDGEPLLERELEAGEHEVAEMRQNLVLRAGNAGALSLTIDGAAARPLGRLGQVVTARLDRENFKDYLLTSPF